MHSTLLYNPTVMKKLCYTNDKSYMRLGDGEPPTHTHTHTKEQHLSEINSLGEPDSLNNESLTFNNVGDDNLV